MIISEKQIMQLMTIVCEYSERLRHMPYDETKEYSVTLDRFIAGITNQQSKELKVVE